MELSIVYFNTDFMLEVFSGLGGLSVLYAVNLVTG